MKRTPLRKIGKVGDANIKARKIIATICEEKGLNHCELQLDGCMGNWPLAPAHRNLRSWYKGDVALLADYRQWVVSCQVCHEFLDRRNAESNKLTEKVFKKLRP